MVFPHIIQILFEEISSVHNERNGCTILYSFHFADGSFAVLHINDGTIIYVVINGQSGCPFQKIGESQLGLLINILYYFRKTHISIDLDNLILKLLRDLDNSV